MNATNAEESPQEFTNACENLPCYFIYGFAIPSFAIFGVIGNLVSAVVLFRFQRQSIINIQLISLCLYDALLLLCVGSLYVPLAQCAYCRKSKINNFADILVLEYSRKCIFYKIYT